MNSLHYRASSHPLLLVSCPVLWIFGGLYITVNGLHCYAYYPLSPNRAFLLGMALLTDLGMLLTLANVLHMALQLPTSALALKFQKWVQLGLWVGLSVCLTGNAVLVDCTSTPVVRFLVEVGGIYVLLTISTFAYLCIV